MGLGGLRAAGRGSPEANPLWPRRASAMDADGRRTAQEVTAARAPKFAPLRTDGPDAPVDPRRIPGPDPAATADGKAAIAGRETATMGGEEAPDLTRGAGGTASRHGTGLPVAGGTDDAPPAGASPAASAPFSPEASSAHSSVIVPPAEGAEGQRLPVFEAVESDWFRRVHNRVGLSAGTAEANYGWASPADDGWRAAETVASPSSSGMTEAGLPKRVPQANLVPGTVAGPQPTAASTNPAGPPRSAITTRERFSATRAFISCSREMAMARRSSALALATRMSASA